MEQMEKQAAHVGTKIVTDLVNKLELGAAAVPPDLRQRRRLISPETVILATGAQARWLGIASEEKFKGFGVLGLRDLRRLLLPRQGSDRGRRRQYRGRGKRCS